MKLHMQESCCLPLSGVASPISVESVVSVVMSTLRGEMESSVGRVLVILLANDMSPVSQDSGMHSKTVSKKCLHMFYTLKYNTF